MSENFDASNYTRLPQFDVPSAIALTTALATAAPDNIPPNVQKNKNKMQNSCQALETSWGIRLKRLKPEDTRPWDRSLDTSWGIVDDRLGSLARLPHDLYPRAVAAQTLWDRVLPGPGRLLFLTLPYDDQWADSERRLKLLRDENLEPMLEDLAGPEVLAELKRTHTDYGQVLGITAPKTSDDESNLMSALLDLRDRMETYVISILGLRDNDDPTTLDTIKKALAPIDDYRERRANSAAPAQNTTVQTPTVVVSDPNN